MKIKHVLATKSSIIHTITPQAPLSQAVAILSEHNIGTLVVIEDDRIAGIISERDIIRAAAQDQAIFERQVQHVMTANVITGRPSDDLKAVLQTMTSRRFRHLPILDGDILLGIVSIGDVVKAQLGEYEGKLDTLETQIIEEG